jgi:hypothetical protein
MVFVLPYNRFPIISYDSVKRPMQPVASSNLRIREVAAVNTVVSIIDLTA